MPLLTPPFAKACPSPPMQPRCFDTYFATQGAALTQTIVNQNAYVWIEVNDSRTLYAIDGRCGGRTFDQLWADWWKDQSDRLFERRCAKQLIARYTHASIEDQRLFHVWLEAEGDSIDMRRKKSPPWPWRNARWDHASGTLLRTGWPWATTPYHWLSSDELLGLRNACNSSQRLPHDVRGYFAWLRMLARRAGRERLDQQTAAVSLIRVATRL
ncbi:hypothetical protein [Stenotrophomonas sp. GZD-301]|uniref:hypothetical protein n=1 Tax=Stenotrophomonas sp. GZD-301 TaxID=3404814 RepID=UPI003BB66E20